MSAVWQGSFAQFEETITAADGLTGGVAVAAVSAALAARILEMALRVAARKNDAAVIRDAITATAREAECLARIPDEDRAAYAAYLAAVRERSPEADAALRRATLVPLAAARSAARVLGLCTVTAPLVRGSVSADVAGSAALLAGAIRAILFSVEANLKQLRRAGLRPPR